MKTILGIELGSTRIKSVLINEKAEVLAKGSYDWENVLCDGLWSYDLDDVWHGLQESYAACIKDYGKPIKKLDCIGISGMMHGYLALDEGGNLLAPFRTWRNTNTEAAARELSALFQFNVPMRWSVAQYYQSVLDALPHVKKVRQLHTLAGYVHSRLTGRHVLGIGDASGMFPMDDHKRYDRTMLEKLNARLSAHGIDVDFETLLPQVLLAGEDAGTLTPEGARLLDPSGCLESGIPLCPPEGDMGTGMICTNGVARRTANLSLGTSANLTVILEKNMKKFYPEIDVIATPAGDPAALIHTNTCTSIIDRWVGLFDEVISLAGGKIDKGELFGKLFRCAQGSDETVGEIACYNYLAGEPIVHVSAGRPMLYHLPEGNFTLANFMQAQLFSAIATLALGKEILDEENVAIDTVYGHGGYFKTPEVGQRAVSALLGAPVTVMQNAGEGGAWGIALLALYLLDPSLPLEEYLASIFADVAKETVTANDDDRKKFAHFMQNYKAGLNGERHLVEG